MDENESFELATRALKEFDDFYHEYITEKGYEDTPIMRGGYYIAVKQEMLESTTFDKTARWLVLRKLDIKIKVAMKEVKLKLMDRINK